MRGPALLLVAAFALHAEQIVTHPWIGITYIDRTEPAPRPIHMHVVQIELTAPGLHFKVSPPGGALEVIRQTTAEFLRQEHAQIAVNTNFFFPWPSAEPESSLIGIAASEGRLYSAFETPVQDYALVADAPGLNIDPENRASIVHYDAMQPDGRHIVENVKLWNTIAGSAQIVTEGNKTIPEYYDPAHPDGLLKPGGPAMYSNQNSWYDATNARTAIGLSKDNRTMTIFTVDVRGGSGGMKIGEVADMLIHDYSVWNALNLDGGGSTSLAMNGALVNASSNTPGDTTAGRTVGASLAIFAAGVKTTP